MSKLVRLGAPVNDGAAHGANRTPRVAVLGAGRPLVICGYQGVLVPALPIGVVAVSVHLTIVAIELRAHHDGAHGEGTGRAVVELGGAQVRTQLDIHRPDNLARPKLLRGLVLIAGVRGQLRFPCADWHPHQSGSTSRFVGTISSNGDGRVVRSLVEGIGCRKAIRYIHMVQLPLAHRVEVERGRDLLDLLDVAGVDIHPIQ